jgi:hypothetical protein
MKKYILFYVVFGLAALTAYFPYWLLMPKTTFYILLYAAMCPHFNIFSTSCGPITAGFVMERIAQAAYIATFVHVLARLVMGWTRR